MVATESRRGLRHVALQAALVELDEETPRLQALLAALVEARQHEQAPLGFEGARHLQQRVHAGRVHVADGAAVQNKRLAGGGQ